MGVGGGWSGDGARRFHAGVRLQERGELGHDGDGREDTTGHIQRSNCTVSYPVVSDQINQLF